jgi:hypothetical protein
MAGLDDASAAQVASVNVQVNTASAETSVSVLVFINPVLQGFYPQF